MLTAGVRTLFVSKFLTLLPTLLLNSLFTSKRLTVKLHYRTVHKRCSW